MGRLVVVEGLDGSGKSTQVEMLIDKLKGINVELKNLDFPCYDDNSSIFVKMYLDGEFGKNSSDISCYGASMFYAADRYVSFLKGWGADYKSGTSFVANRYTTSNAVHQMSKLSEEEWDDYLTWLFDFEYVKLSLPAPDLVVFLDVDPNISRRMMLGRYNGNKELLDIHEKDLDYQRRCQKAAMYCCKTMGWKVINCSKDNEIRDKERISEELFNIIEPIFT